MNLDCMERDVEMDNLSRTINQDTSDVHLLFQVLTNPPFGPLGISHPLSEIIHVRSPFQKS